MHGVDRLLSMQTVEGGFSFWPGGTQPTYWGSAYVTHLLLEGKAAGYPIPQDRIDDALETLTQFASEHNSSEVCRLITDCHLRKYDTDGAMAWFKKELEEFSLSGSETAFPLLDALHRSGRMEDLEGMIRYFREHGRTSTGEQGPR